MRDLRAMEDVVGANDMARVGSSGGGVYRNLKGSGNHIFVAVQTLNGVDAEVDDIGILQVAALPRDLRLNSRGGREVKAQLLPGGVKVGRFGDGAGNCDSAGAVRRDDAAGEAACVVVEGGGGRGVGYVVALLAAGREGDPEVGDEPLFGADEVNDRLVAREESGVLMVFKLSGGAVIRRDGRRGCR